MSERDVLNNALSEYHVNMNIVTPLIDKVVEDEGTGGGLIVHLQGTGAEVPSYMEDILESDTPVMTAYEAMAAGNPVIFHFKEYEATEEEIWYPVEFFEGPMELNDDITGKNIVYAIKMEHDDNVIGYIDVNTLTEHWIYW